MRAELLLFDIGNTSTKIGLADAERVLTTYSLRTDAEQTADSLGLSLLALCGHAGLDMASVRACMVSSVVPDFTPILREALTRYVRRPVFFVPADVPLPLENRYARPEQVGADRLVGAYAARRLYPGPESLMVVDFGTAVTFDCIARDVYEGGLIFPGPKTALAALARHAAQLTRVDLEVDALVPAVGRDTVTSIQHGLVFGFVGMVEGLVARLCPQLPGTTRILATGGFAQSIARLSPVFDEVLPSLLLEGLRRLFYECRPA